MISTLLLTLLPVLWILPGVAWALPDPERIGAAQVHTCFVGTAVFWCARENVCWREFLWVPALMLPALWAGAGLEGQPEAFWRRAVLLLGWCGLVLSLQRSLRGEARAHAIAWLVCVVVIPPLVGLFARDGASISACSPWTAALQSSEEPWPVGALALCVVAGMFAWVSCGNRVRAVHA